MARRPAVPAADRIGKRFNRWIVLSIVERLVGGGARILARCDCGLEKIVILNNVTSGNSRSCGCLARETHSRTHGLSATRMYNLWVSMRDRCENPKNKSFHRYGGRGIAVCERWRASFEAFALDMGPRPPGKSNGRALYSIERDDNDRGYEPGNCRWATQKEQQHNTRRNVWLEHDGIKMIATDWAKRLNISRQRMQQRIAQGLCPELLFAPGSAKRSRAARQRRLRVLARKREAA